MTNQDSNHETREIRLQFTHQSYQEQAVQAVVQVFDGQPMATGGFGLAGDMQSSTVYSGDGAIGNQLLLTREQLLTNVQKVQRHGDLPESAELAASFTDDGEPLCPLNFTLEMETGTGKTYTFIRTMHELHRLYGFCKFVIVTPSVAIREGTLKNLAITRSHFAADYGNAPFVRMAYDSSRLNDLRHFAQSDALSVLVINIDSFARDGTRINQKGERAFAPIEFVQKTRPIVIVDEPQNFETDARRRALMALNPLCTLRYSATHRNPYNLLYRLDPVQAYDLGLVKQIEVDGVVADGDHNQPFVQLLDIKQKATSVTATVRMDVNGAEGVLRKKVALKPGDDLHAKSKKRDAYASGYVVNEIRAEAGEIEFSGGLVLRLNQQQGGNMDAVMRYQIERTVAAHFAKLKKLQPLGVKVLSLFFIDRVAHYRGHDEDGNPVPGKFAQWFEEAFNTFAQKPPYAGLIPHEAAAVHGGYFSGDRKGKGAKAQTIWRDTGGDTARDADTYALIMKDKEQLLSMNEPLQFIFSHSALREGWDNPNVFQICTLGETQSALKKRQEIGRGLRLPVNRHGARVQDKSINVLTVIPNESYEAFARSLQQEIEEETGVPFEGRVKNARAKARIARKTLSAEEEALLKDIWNRISYQTRYSVRLDTPELITACVNALQDTSQYPRVQRPKVRSARADLLISRAGVQARATGVGERQATAESAPVVPDVYAFLQRRVRLSRGTLFAILDQSGRLDELLVNPQAFLDMAATAMNDCLQELLVQGIEYREIGGHRYKMTLLGEQPDAYLDNVFPSADATVALCKTVLQAHPLHEDKAAFDCVITDSDVENQFARDCALDERVRLFFKLPPAFRIDTPLGDYNPDWAVVFDGEAGQARVCFVAETKSGTRHKQLRRDEKLKITCGRKHFALAPDVQFEAVDSLRMLKGLAEGG